MNVVVVVEVLEEFAYFGTLLGGEFGKILRDVAHFAGHNAPAVLGEPLRDGMDCRAVGDEAGAGCACGNVVVLLMAERLDFVRAGLDGRGLDVAAGIGMMRLDQANVIKEKLVAAPRAELALLEKDADFRRGPVLLSVTTSTITGTLCGA